MARAVWMLSLVALAATGCGGESGPLSEEELISRGDELCREGQERFEAIQATPPANAAAAVRQTRELVEVAAEELEALRELEPPTELAQPYRRYLEARRRALELLERGRDAAEARDSAAYGTAQDQSQDELAQRRRLARAVGFRRCSQGPPTS